MAGVNDASVIMFERFSLLAVASALTTVLVLPAAGASQAPGPAASPPDQLPAEILQASQPMQQYALGYSYEKGLYRELDYSKAAYWYQQAADQGFARAQYRLALLYMLGHLNARDPEQAEQLFRSAALQGYSPAQFDLAAYHMGLNPKQQKDLAESYAWFSIVAEHGGDDAVNARQFLQHLAGQLNGNDLARARQLQSSYEKQISP